MSESAAAPVKANGVHAESEANDEDAHVAKRARLEPADDLESESEVEEIGQPAEAVATDLYLDTVSLHT